MSAFGYKQTFKGQLANVRFTPESGHSEAQERGQVRGVVGARVIALWPHN